MHPATLEVLQHFAFAHLPTYLQEASKPFAVLAVQMVQGASGPEVTAGLRHLLEAKDCFVRAVRTATLDKDAELRRLAESLDIEI